MMLSRREIQLLEYLEHRKIATGAEIADKMRISKRTIIRDISHINHVMTGLAVIHNDGKGYQLKIQEKKGFLQLLGSSGLDDELILLTLLTTPFISLDKLSEQIYISKPTLIEQMLKLRQQYKNRIAIKSKPNQGHYLEEALSKRITLLANIIDENPSFFCSKLSVGIDQYEKLVQVIRLYFDEIAYPNIHSEHLASLFLSSKVLTSSSDSLTQDTVADDSIYAKIFGESGIRITPETIPALHDFLEDQRSCSKLITIENIMDIMRLMEQEYHIHICDLELVNQLAEHLKRSIAYPQILSNSHGYILEEMKALYPLAFDLSIKFIQLISKKFQFELYDIDLIGLYFSSALTRNKPRSEKIILFSNQYSVANINKLMIEQKFPEIEVLIIHRKRELEKVLATKEWELLINNQDNILSLEENIPIIDVKQIIHENDLTRISDTLKRIEIQKNINLYFSEENAFIMETNRSDSWQVVIEKINEILLDKKILLPEEAQKIMQREQAGNNLVINHIAIPHCTITREVSFFSIFIHLTQPIRVEGEIVHNVLLSCMNTNVRTGIKVFNYLYHTLSQQESDVVLNIETYEQFISLFHS